MIKRRIPDDGFPDPNEDPWNCAEDIYELPSEEESIGKEEPICAE